MLKTYNSLSRKKEALYPKGKKKVRMFVCGITPYDFAHLGHARTYLVFDMVAKYLKTQNYKVFYLQNITDIDDKIIERAKNTKKRPKEVSRFFEKEYLKDMKSLRIDSITKYARATDFIKEIQSQVKRLMKKGYAYQLKDGIYYDISKFRDYGKLSKRTVLQAEDAVSKIDEGKGKGNKGDFSLWKLSKPNEPKWKSPWGEGRPGWHIEDTAITEHFFGPQYDIHGGARDLIFPHHEAEIAQMEALSGKHPLAKHWLHSGFLTINGQKMSKSLGNFITIRDFIKEYSPQILRLFVLKTHYRSPIDYRESKISQTKKELEKIKEFVSKIKKVKSKNRNKDFQISKFQKEFKKAMDDDFNTPKAIAVIFNLINKGNSLLGKNQISKKQAKEILNFLKETDQFFGFIFWKETIEIPSQVKKLAKEREKARKNKDWEKADEIRGKVKEMGFQIEDTKEGPKIKAI